jgi:hypothetical protein
MSEAISESFLNFILKTVMLWPSYGHSSFYLVIIDFGKCTLFPFWFQVPCGRTTSGECVVFTFTVDVEALRESSMLSYQCWQLLNRSGRFGSETSPV